MNPDCPGETGGAAEAQSTRFRKQVIEAVVSAPGGQLVVVDFDETLFLRNSTTEYLRAVRPYVFGRVLYHVLNRFRPWSWFRGRSFGVETRDWFHVIATTVLFPWTILVWRRQARVWAAKWKNAALVEAVRGRIGKRVIVSSQGFAFILRPMLKLMGLGQVELDACRFWLGFRDRARGKLGRLSDRYGPAMIREALVVTDSEHDRPLLDLAARPFLVRWPQPNQATPGGAYVPFMFMLKVKHAGWGHARSVILAEDLFLLWLGMSMVNPQPVLHGLAMVFMMISFWLVYEMGYMENDLVAEKYEKEPVLKEEYFRRKDLITFREPWVWACLAALPGVWLLHAANELQGSVWERIIDGGLWLSLVAAIRVDAESLSTLGWWILVLVSLRLVYFVYNHADKMSRAWLYPLLQGFRSFGFVVTGALSLVGAIVFISTVISRWILYSIYRAGRVEWPGTEMGQMVRLVLFAGLAAVVFAFSQSSTEILTLQGGVILGWCLLRARRSLWRIVRDAHHVSRDSWKSSGR